MAISIAKLKRATELRFHASGGDFDFAFYAAINDVIQDLIADTVIKDLKAINENNPPATIDIDEAYYPPFREGVPYYIQRSAAWARTNEAVSDAFYRQALAEAQARAIDNVGVDTGWGYDNDEDGNA